MQRMRRIAWLGILGVLLCAGCGEEETKVGSNGSGVPSPPQESMSAAGPIAELGPLGISGASLDESSAVVQLNTLSSRGASDLRLGMVADMAGLMYASPATGSISVISAQSSVIGQATSVDSAAKTFTVLGNLFVADQNTLFENTTGLSGPSPIRAGQRLEVYGILMATVPAPRALATRVVRQPVVVTSPVELFGTVTTTLIGAITVTTTVTTVSTTVTTASTTGAPSVTTVTLGCTGVCGQEAGAKVRVVGTPNADNSVTATQLYTGFRSRLPDGQLAVLDGFVLQLLPTGTVLVGDEQVDLSATGLSGVLVGTRLEVRGRKQLGVVRASHARAVPATETRTFVIEGTVGQFASIGDFFVRGEKVSAANALFAGGSSADVVSGRRVQVRGVAGPGRIDATVVTLR